MLCIDESGYIGATKIIKRIFHSLHRGDMAHVDGIVVYQTGLLRYKAPQPLPARGYQRYPFSTLKISLSEIFRPPDIARTNKTKASSAKW